jgi:hypothetical protein
MARCFFGAADIIFIFINTPKQGLHTGTTSSVEQKWVD